MSYPSSCPSPSCSHTYQTIPTMLSTWHPEHCNLKHLYTLTTVILQVYSAILIYSVCNHVENIDSIFHNSVDRPKTLTDSSPTLTFAL